MQEMQKESYLLSSNYGNRSKATSKKNHKQRNDIYLGVIMQTGRTVLYTDVPEITYDNVIDVLRSVIPTHETNASEIQMLLNFDSGIQPITRVKKSRPDIDCRCVDNVANEITEFALGFQFGSPMTLVQKGNKTDSKVSDGITELNENYEAVHIASKTQEFGRFLVIAGVAYVYIDTNMDWKDESDGYFTENVLDPRTTFVVRSSYYTDRRVMLAVCYRKDNSGNKYYTCFSNKWRFEIVNAVKITGSKRRRDKDNYNHGNSSGSRNVLNRIPIVEYIRSFDRTGLWERQIPEMNDLNLAISNFSNDVDQNTQAIWHGNDVVFPTKLVKNEDGTETEVVVKPETNEWLLTYTPENGKEPFVKPLAVDYDYAGMLNNIITKRQLILQKCNVPQRNDNSGGSTGVAMSDATGWSQAETAAAKQQMIIDGCKMEEVAVVLEAIKKSPFINPDNPMLYLKKSDIAINVKRQKTYEMSTKVNAMATLLSHGFYGEDVVNAIPFFDDPNEVWNRSKELIEKYQSSIFDKSSQNQAQGGEGEQKPNSDRTMQDLSDQVSNSPVIDKSRTDK
jgi:SPP1 family phage portal protein|nr:MAG TPA: Portal [Caudoviricetes sp.]